MLYADAPGGPWLEDLPKSQSHKTKGMNGAEDETARHHSHLVEIEATSHAKEQSLRYLPARANPFSLMSGTSCGKGAGTGTALTPHTIESGEPECRPRHGRPGAMRERTGVEPVSRGVI